jgi:hypothetical protein
VHGRFPRSSEPKRPQVLRLGPPTCRQVFFRPGRIGGIGRKRGCDVRPGPEFQPRGGRLTKRNLTKSKTQYIDRPPAGWFPLDVMKVEKCKWDGSLLCSTSTQTN